MDEAVVVAVDAFEAEIIFAIITRCGKIKMKKNKRKVDKLNTLRIHKIYIVDAV